MTSNKPLDAKKVRYRATDLTKLARLIEKAELEGNQNFERAALDIVAALGRQAREGTKNYFLWRHILNEFRRKRERVAAAGRQPLLPGFEARFVHLNSRIFVNGRFKLMATAPLDEVEEAIQQREAKASSIDRRRAAEERQLLARARELKALTLQEAAEKLEKISRAAKIGSE